MGLAQTQDGHDLTRFLRRYRGYRGISRFSMQKTGLTKALILADRTDESNSLYIIDPLAELGCLPIYPVRTANGLEVWHALAHNRKNVQVLYSKLKEVGDVKSFSTRSSRFDDFSREDLTRKQFDCLAQAYSHGYFNWPRAITAEKMAETLGVSTATFFEHMRKAQQKIVHQFFAESMIQSVALTEEHSSRS